MIFLSWGVGIQSTVLAAMSALGELPPLDAVIHSDTGWERQATYDACAWWTAWLRERGVRVEIVSGGDIRRDGARDHLHIPFRTDSGAPLNRQCTKYFKIIPTKRRVRELLGYHSSETPHPPTKSAELWLGISVDEWTRAKPSRVKFVVHRWPLLEKRMTRIDCIDWLGSHGLPVPPRSSCVCCPYRRASEWIEMRDNWPDEWADVIVFDEANRHNPLAGISGSTADSLYLWRDGEPLATADLERAAAKERRKYGTQLPLFMCESGFCGT